MTEEDEQSSSSVHLHEADAKFQNDDCITTDNDVIMNQIHAQQHQKRLSLVRLESGRQIWWLDNGISSHRAEIMLRRRMRYLQEEQEQQQQQQLVVLRENHDNNIDLDNGVDDGPRSNHERGGQHNNIISTAISDDSHNTPTKEPIIPAVPPSEDIGPALSKKMNTKITSQHLTHTFNTINAVNEVSLESIDEPTPHPSQSNQQLIQHCHENNIPVITVGTIKPSHKETWMDFGEDNDNTVGEVSSRQFLIYASTESDTIASGATSSAALVANDSSIINIELERMSSKEGFICMLHDSSSFTECTNNLDPIQLQLKDGEAQMIHVIWNPIQEGCVRENIGLRINMGGGQIVRHDIVLVGSARESDHTIHAIEPSNAIIEKEEWNGVSVEYSEIKEDGSKHDLIVYGVGLTVTEESIECSSIATNGGVANGLIHSHEVDELTHMMQTASISPKKASMAAKSLSQLPKPRNEDDEASNRSPNRRVDAKQIMAVQEEIDSGRVFAEENRLISQTSQDFVNGLYMNDKVRHLLDDFDAESVSTDGRGSGRSTPTFGSFSSEEEKSIPSDVSQRVNENDKQQLGPQVEAAEETLTAEQTETGGASVVASQEKCILSDVSERLHDEQQFEPEVESVEENMAAENAEAGGERAVANLDEKQQSPERFNTTTSDHYDKVTAELNALMEDVSDDLKSQSESDYESYSSESDYDSCSSESDYDSFSSSEEYDQSRDEKGGFFNFDESMSNEENEELNMLPEASLDHSSDWESSGVDVSTDSDQLRNPYRRMISDVDALMDEVSELEQFAQMQQNYLTSPTTHNFQTQLENINEQIDNFTPSPANTMRPTHVARNMSENQSALRMKDTKKLKTASEPPTPKVAAKRCYFYKSPRKVKNKPSEKALPSEKVSTLSTPKSDVMEEKRVPYKSPYAAVFEAETSFQSTGSMMGSSSSSDGSDCASRPTSDETDPSDDILAESSSLNESISSGESEFGTSSNSSADLNEDTSSSISSCETSSSVSSQNKEMNGIEGESQHETRSEQIASLKSKLSSWKEDNDDQCQTPSVSTAKRYSSPTKLPQSPSSTRKVQFKNPAAKTLDASPLKASASTSQKMSKAIQYSSPSEVPRTTPSSRKLQLNTPANKTLDVASLTVSATSTAQKSARMTYGHFSQSPTTEISSSDSEETKTSRLPTKKSVLNTPPPPKRAPSQLKTPSSISAYEKHIERMRKSRAKFFS